jgi:serine/threonine protein phosphatase PrpC
MLAQKENDVSGIVYSTVLERYGTMVHTDTIKLLPATLQVSCATDPGIRHRYRPNEDTLSIVQGYISSAMTKTAPRPFVLLIVADGMGGLGHGREASRLATRTFVEYVTDALHHHQGNSDDLQPLLSAGVQYANQSLYTHSQQQNRAMGTTLTAALIIESTAYIAHVGDSRLYHYCAAEGMTQITRDHSIVAELVEAGAIPPEAIYTHPMRNRIFRSLGTETTVEVDTAAIQLFPDDVLFLCTDGLWEMVRDQHIANTLSVAMPLPETTQALIQAAIAGGGADNISTIIAKMRTMPTRQGMKIHI